MKKPLPKIKKTLKSFILEEDAKVINKTFIKIAISSSFMALVGLHETQDVSAHGHTNYEFHTNSSVFYNDNYSQIPLKTGQEDSNLFNPSDNSVDYKGKNLPSRSVGAYHNNMTNHNNSGGGYL